MTTPTLNPRSLVLTGIGELVSLAPLAEQKKTRQPTLNDLGIVQNAWLWLENGRVKDFGPMRSCPTGAERFDVHGALVMPGFIDCHTHPLFAGNREQEFLEKLGVKTYQQIAAEGGGIRLTVKKTRAASDAELTRLLELRLQTFLRQGVTTVEVKSGYGLSVAEELRHLRILHAAHERLQTLSITCLAFHDWPLESRDTYLRDVVKDLLPQAAPFCHSVDAFIEGGYFSVAQCQEYFAAAQALGLQIRVHADEFSDAGAALAAAQWNAASADHLQWAADDGVKAMGASGVTAVLLPGTSLFSKIPFTQAARFRTAGCPIAVATDFNPGSAPIGNISLMASLAAVQCGLSAPEALAAVTYVPARSLGFSDRGALARTFSADLVVYNNFTLASWIADFGQTSPSHVFLRGNPIP